MSIFETNAPQILTREAQVVITRSVVRRFNGICAVTLKYTQGVRTHQYNQLGLMVMAYGVDFIITDFTEWCLSPEAAKAEHPFHTYFAGFDKRMRGLPERTSSEQTSERTTNDHGRCVDPHCAIGGTQDERTAAG